MSFDGCATHACVTIDIGQEAAEAALSDVGLSYSCVEAVVASYCYGDPTCGV